MQNEPVSWVRTGVGRDSWDHTAPVLQAGSGREGRAWGAWSQGPGHGIGVAVTAAASASPGAPRPPAPPSCWEEGSGLPTGAARGSVCCAE